MAAPATGPAAVGTARRRGNRRPHRRPPTAQGGRASAEDSAPRPSALAGSNPSGGRHEPPGGRSVSWPSAAACNGTGPRRPRRWRPSWNRPSRPLVPGAVDRAHWTRGWQGHHQGPGPRSRRLPAPGRLTSPPPSSGPSSPRLRDRTAGPLVGLPDLSRGGTAWAGGRRRCSPPGERGRGDHAR